MEWWWQLEENNDDFDYIGCEDDDEDVDYIGCEDDEDDDDDGSNIQDVWVASAGRKCFVTLIICDALWIIWIICDALLVAWCLHSSSWWCLHSPNNMDSVPWM